MNKSRRIINYVVISYPDDHKLVEEVNKLIRKGFQPLGGPTAALSKEGNEVSQVIVQAMVQYEED